MDKSQPADINLLDANETLRKCLVKVSFAAAGIQKQMDIELQKLRELIRADAIEDDIHEQVENIARALRAIDEESQSQRANLSYEELLENLQMLLSAELPDLQNKIDKIISKGANHTLMYTLQKLVNITPHPEKNSSSSGIFGKLFKSSETNESDPAELVEKVSQTINKLLGQLHIPENLNEKIEFIYDELKSLNTLQEFPPIMEAISAIVLDLTFEDQLRFESFLKQLGQKLDFVQQMIENTSIIQSKNNEAASELNKEMRDHVQQLHANIKHANSLTDLQESVQGRLEKVISALDTFNGSRETFVQNNNKQITTMSQKLFESRNDIKMLEQQLKDQQQLAETDMLTRLPNRYAFQRRMEDEHIRWRRYRHPVAICIADIDHFKKVNDSYGHSVGDSVLLQIATMLHDGMRDSDFIARYGGEEFVIILPETTLTKATKAINKLRLKMAEHSFDLEGNEFNVTVSFGVAEFEEDDDINDVLKRSDNALYRAKEKGRDQVCCEMKSLVP